MKKLLALSILLLYHLLSSAQNPAPKATLKGQVIDSATQAPVNATIVLSDPKSAVPLRSMASGTDGVFRIEVPAGKSYVLHVSAVGYRTIGIAVVGVDRDLGRLGLALAEAALQNAVVIASRKVIKQEIDRISYDVQADPDSKANDALEMLRKVPMVTVDANDVVQLKGSSNFQIFINGKPSALMVASPSDVLKAMPAAAIQKIEVITVPPSKYDGEGLAGIINIITLKSATDGINGSLFARYNSVFGERGSASVNVNQGRFSMTSLLGLGRQPARNAATGSELTNYSPASTLSQQGQRSDGGNFNNGKADLSFELDSSDLLTASGDFFNRRFDQIATSRTTLVYAPDSVAQSYDLRNVGPIKVSALDASAGYQRKLLHTGSVNLNYRYASSTNSQANTLSVSDAYDYTGGGYTQANHLQIRTHNIEIGLIQPVGRLVVEAGAKAILGTNDSYFSDDAAVDDFSYHQNIYSGYNSYEVKVPGWDLKAGLRLENTVINSSYSQASAPIRENYLNLLPALSFQRNLAANSSFTLGFTQRMQRAQAGQLNPFIDKSNPSFIVTGNPALRPVINNIIEFDYSRSARLSINANVDYTFANNPIQSVTELISDTVSESTYQNVGSNRTAGVHLTLNYPLFTRLNLILNTQLSHVWLTGTYNAQYYRNDGDRGNAAASARYSFAHQLTATINFNYKSGDVFLQGKSSNYTYVGFNVIKEFLQRRATLSVTAFSPWRKYAEFSSSTKTPDFGQVTSGQFYDRNFRFAFNYKFGRLKKVASAPKGDEE